MSEDPQMIRAAAFLSLGSDTAFKAMKEMRDDSIDGLARLIGYLHAIETYAKLSREAVSEAVRRKIRDESKIDAEVQQGKR